jgi:hypothetical protein
MFVFTPEQWHQRIQFTFSFTYMRKYGDDKKIALKILADLHVFAALNMKN